VSELHLDERFNTGKEALGKHLATGQKKVSSAFNHLWADIEAMREAQRQRQEEQRAASSASPSGTPKSEKARRESLNQQLFRDDIDHHLAPRSPHLAEAQAHVAAASSRAGAYLSSWAVWAGEKRKTGWSRSATIAPVTSQNEGSQLGFPDETNESGRQKALGGSSSDSSTGGNLILSEYTSREESKPGQMPLEKVEPLPGNISHTSQGTAGKTLGKEGPTSEHKTQETLSGDLRRASVKT
jgi:hypothetical protein